MVTFLFTREITDFSIYFSEKLKTDEKQTLRFDIIPRKSGDRKLLVDVDSSQAKDFKGFADVKVLEA